MLSAEAICKNKSTCPVRALGKSMEMEVVRTWQLLITCLPYKKYGPTGRREMFRRMRAAKRISKSSLLQPLKVILFYFSGVVGIQFQTLKSAHHVNCDSPSFMLS